MSGRTTVYDLEDGDLFTWQNEIYVLLSIDDYGNAKVRYWDEKKPQHEQNFNAYAPIEPCKKEDAS